MSTPPSASRPFDPLDDDRVVALLARLHADDPTVDAMSLERWRAFRGLAIFEEGRRFRVVEEAGDLAALLTVGKLDPKGPDPFPWRADPRVRFIPETPMHRARQRAGTAPLRASGVRIPSRRVHPAQAARVNEARGACAARALRSAG